MKAQTILLGLMLLPLSLAVPAQTPSFKPATTAHPQSAADAAARKQLAAYLTEYRNDPTNADLRDKIIELAKTLKPAPEVAPAVRTEFAKAMAQLKAAGNPGDDKAAAAAFEQVAAQAPWWADAYLNAASAYAKAGELSNAKLNLALYNSAVRPGVSTAAADDLQSEIDRQKAEAERQKAEAARQQAQQQFQQALQAYQSNPTDSALTSIIKLAADMNPPPEVPAEAKRHISRGMVAIDDGMAATKTAKNEEDLKNATNDFEDADNEFSKAVSAAPWFGDGYRNLAIAANQAKDYDRALRDLDWYLMSKPASAEVDWANDLKAKIEYRKEKAEQERQDTIRAEQQRQEEHRRQCDQFAQDVNNGNTAYQNNRYEDAIDLYNKALRDGCPEHSEAGMAYTGLAGAYADKGDLQEGLSIARKGLDIYPDYPNLHGMLGNLLWKSGDRSGACQHWHRACNLGSQMGCSNLTQYAQWSPVCK